MMRFCRSFCTHGYYKALSNDLIVALASSGKTNLLAKDEQLVRHIMSVDQVSRDQAFGTLQEIKDYNHQGQTLLKLPYYLGIGLSLGAATLTLPMCYHQDVIMWFNNEFVTTDLPDDKDLETVLEIGIWSWNWIEPVLGQISFMLLCLQFARAQLMKMKVKPYTEWMLDQRGRRLTKKYHQYDPLILRDFAEHNVFN